MLNSFKTENRVFKPFTGIDFYRSRNISLKIGCDSVVDCRIPYEDAAEMIELKAYELCETGRIDEAIEQLNRIAVFFENLENKNDEHSRDLADVYLLIGQMLQYAGRYDESIGWFSKSVIVDDQYATPYHNLAISYDKTGKVDSAIRCLKQELLISPGNYYSYLILAEIYKRKRKYEAYEECLHQLLERDPQNLQGLFRLIRYYETKKTGADVSLLCRKVLSIHKKFSTTEWMIRVYTFCILKKFTSALNTADEWEGLEPKTSLVNLTKAYAYGAAKKVKERGYEIDIFVNKNGGDIDKMSKKLDDFGGVFGQNAKIRISKTVIRHALERYSPIALLNK
ncbi:MAG: tetratricopeptide repeat protein [Fibrobacter sp.]|nr:tetratricopeptide repeat protein [Fibrobacter sp.]